MSLNLLGSTYTERVDEMLCGTMLGGEKEMAYRAKHFKESLVLPLKNKARELWKYENIIREQNNVPKVPFDYQLPKDQENAADLITGLSICQALKDPYNIAGAKYMYQYIESMPSSYLKKRLDVELNLLDDEHKKLVAPYFEGYKNSEYPEGSKLEALFLLRDEMVKEGERRNATSMYSNEGNYYYYPNIPITSNYQWGNGWMNSDDRLEFKSEVKRILPVGGWKYVASEDSGHADELVCGKSYAYIHPMSLSVFGRKEEVDELLNHIQQLTPKNFKFGSVDMYPPRVVKDMTYREVYEAYKGQEKDIRIDILSSIDGKKGTYSIADEVYKRHRIVNAAESNMIGMSSGEIGYMFVEDVLKDMVKNKVLEIGKKMELKKVKKRIVLDKNEEKSNIRKR